MATKYKRPKRLTASDYLLFNEMISRIRTLETMATKCFMKGDLDRSKFAEKLGKQVDRIQKGIKIYYGKCRFPHCDGGNGVCEVCFMNICRKELQEALERLSSERTG